MTTQPTRPRPSPCSSARGRPAQYRSTGPPLYRRPVSPPLSPPSFPQAPLPAAHRRAQAPRGKTEFSRHQCQESATVVLAPQAPLAPRPRRTRRRARAGWAHRPLQQQLHQRRQARPPPPLRVRHRLREATAAEKCNSRTRSPLAWAWASGCRPSRCRCWRGSFRAGRGGGIFVLIKLRIGEPERDRVLCCSLLE